MKRQFPIEFDSVVDHQDEGIACERVKLLHKLLQFIGRGVVEEDIDAIVGCEGTAGGCELKLTDFLANEITDYF